MIAGFQAIETLLVLQVEMNKFRHFVMVAVDLTGNCLLCDTDYILTRVKINHLPNSTQTIDFETRKRIQWHHSTYIFYETGSHRGRKEYRRKAAGKCIAHKIQEVSNTNFYCRSADTIQGGHKQS